MGYEILSINQEELTMIIRWESGEVLNHYIPPLLLQGGLSVEQMDEVIRGEYHAG